MKYFQESEFVMDGKPVFGRMNKAFLEKLDTCRHLAGVPFHITSSYRTPEKNRRVGGSPGSMHLKGRAVDVLCTDGIIRAAIVKSALSMGLSVGIMRSAVHIDDREIQTVFHYYDSPRGRE